MKTEQEKREYKRKWRDANLERVRKSRRKSMRKWRAANPEKDKERCRKWRIENLDIAKKIGKEWREANPEKVKNRVKEWKKNNPDKVRIQSCKRRARKLNAEGSFTAEDTKNLYATQGGRCYYCSTGIKEEYHIDHMTPLSREGSNWPENLCLACVPCNLTKNTKTAEEFIEQKGFMNGI